MALLTGAGSMMVSVQSYPALLQIVQERLNPDAERAYGEVEEKLAHLCTRMDAPNRYLALASVAVPTEVWWLNEYGSYADMERVRSEYALRPELTAAMNALAREKTGLTSAPIDVLTTLRPDLSDGSPWRIGELRFAVIAETRVPARSPGTVYQAPDGWAFVFVAASTRAGAEQLASKLGSGGRVFEVRPEWSRPYHRWVASNPELWKCERPED